MKNSAKTSQRKRKARAKARQLLKKAPEVAKADFKDAHKELRSTRNKRIVVEEGSIEVIPELDHSWAELLLSNLSTDQRKLRPLHLARIERALKAGTFLWTGESIKIDEDFNVKDGQHRLTAVYNTNIPIKNAILVMIRDKEVMKVLDTTSAPRSLGDIHKVYGLKSPGGTIIAAILYEKFDFIRKTSRELSKPEKFDLLQNYDLVEEAIVLRNAGQRAMRVTAGPLAGALRCVRKNRELALRFFSAAFSNVHFLEEASKDYPDETMRVTYSQIALLSNWLIHVRELQQAGTGRTSGEEFMREGAIKAIRAWNAFRSGKHLTKLQMPRNGKMPVPRR
jgi:hypothetical protein